MIPPFLTEELREYISYLYGIMADERMFQFTKKSYMEHEIIREIKAFGVKWISLHDLRHSHASLLVEIVFTQLAIAERLGHEKIEAKILASRMSKKITLYAPAFKTRCAWSAEKN